MIPAVGLDERSVRVPEQSAIRKLEPQLPFSSVTQEQRRKQAMSTRISASEPGLDDRKAARGIER